MNTFYDALRAQVEEAKGKMELRDQLQKNINAWSYNKKSMESKAAMSVLAETDDGKPRYKNAEQREAATAERLRGDGEYQNIISWIGDALDKKTILDRDVWEKETLLKIGLAEARERANDRVIVVNAGGGRDG
jgi:hypothetical protein